MEVVGPEIYRGVGFRIGRFLERLQDQMAAVWPRPVRVYPNELEEILKDPAYDHPLGPTIYAFTGMPSPCDEFRRSLKWRGISLEIEILRQGNVWVFSAAPVRCPICNGRKYVERYERTSPFDLSAPSASASFTLKTEQCHKCKGIGTVPFFNG